MQTSLKKIAGLIFLSAISAGNLLAALDDDEVIRLLDASLKTLPDRVAKINPKLRRISFYSLRVDRTNISQPLFRQISGKIESAFVQLERPVLVYTPEIKPLRVVSKEDTISFTSGFQSSAEIKKLSNELKLDGLLVGDLYITAKNVLYLNLRIFDTENLAVAWSEEFTSKGEEPAIMTGGDIGLGGSAIQMIGTKTAADEVPSFANYYSADLRIWQRLLANSNVKFTVSAGLMYLYSGLKSTSAVSTMVSYKTLGTFSFLGKIGLRVPIISAKVKKNEQLRDWLATEFSYGRILGLGTAGLSTFGLRVESDITKDVTIALGFSYLPITDIEYAPGAMVQVGGLAYEISLLRFNIAF